MQCKFPVCFHFSPVRIQFIPTCFFACAPIIGHSIVIIMQILTISMATNGPVLYPLVLLKMMWEFHLFQVADAAAADGLHQLVVSGPHRR